MTDEGSGDPVAGAWVLAIGRNGPTGGAITAADGTYALAELPVGDYRLAFIDGTGGHRHEYWDDHAGFADSDLLAVTSGGSATADAALGH